MEENGVSGLMVSRNPLFFLRNNPAVLLRPDADMNEGLVNIALLQVSPFILSGKDRRFVHEILQIRPRESRCRARDNLKIHVI